jgi:RNA polymerase sigma-70 factor (ECF subfamily)
LDVSEHFFRHESGRLVAALTRVFGVHQLALAEDVTQHAFCRALEVWKVRGIPENPSAWLLATAKHRALDLLRRERTARNFAPELSRRLDSEGAISSALDEAFLAGSVRYEQLRMMFSCCHPRLGQEAQLALVLNMLCGFGASEIAGALLTGLAAIEKRIARGKQTLAQTKTLFDLADAEFEARLSTVQRALYLLFNEGYHGAGQSGAIRRELCHEALRLTCLLGEHAPAATPTTKALAALMSLHAARLPARVDAEGELLAFFEQDRRRWDGKLVADGLTLFDASATGNELSPYHVEAAIAVAHASAPSFAETDWSRVVELYDRLMSVAPSPVVALNRAIAIGHHQGAARALAELRAIAFAERLRTYPFYPAALGEFELRLGNYEAARQQLQRAISLARNDDERHFLAKRLAAAGHGGAGGGCASL